MRRLLIQFLVVAAAVVVGLFGYDTIRSRRATGDFGAGAAAERQRIMRSDFQRAAATAKLASSEYYLSNARWATSNREAGLPEPESYRGESLRRLELAGARIILTFDARSGQDGGQVILTGFPTPNLAMGIDWRCTSPNLPDIAASFPACAYGEAPAEPPTATPSAPTSTVAAPAPAPDAAPPSAPPSAAPSAAEIEAQASQKAQQLVLARYRQAATMRVHARAVGASEKDGKLTVWALEDAQLAVDRARGLRATTQATDRSGGELHATAWGPLDAIRSYREDRHEGAISHVESRKPDERANEFDDLGAFQYASNPIRTVLDCIVHGRFDHPDQGTWKVQDSASAIELVHQTGAEPYVQERRYQIAPDGRVLSFSGSFRESGKITRFAARFDPQEFGVSIGADELEYEPPEYADAFDIRGPLDGAARRARIIELAEKGNHDAKIRLAIGSSFNPTSSTPKATQFSEAVARLTEVEESGFAFAYNMHAQMMQPDNRDWFPAELKKLPDAEIRRRQRALYFQGAEHCSGDAAFAVAMDRNHPPSDEEKKRLASYASACEEKRLPAEIRALQARVDAGAGLEDLLK